MSPLKKCILSPFKSICKALISDKKDFFKLDALIEFVNGSIYIICLRLSKLNYFTIKYLIVYNTYYICMHRYNNKQYERSVFL